MLWVLQVTDFLIHAVNDLKVCLFLTLIETLQICRLTCAFLCIEETFRGSSCSTQGSTLGSSLLGALHGILRLLGLTHLAHGSPAALASLVQGVVTDYNFASRGPSTSLQCCAL